MQYSTKDNIVCYITLHCIALLYIALHYMLYYVILHYITVHFISLHCTILKYIDMLFFSNVVITFCHVICYSICAL